MLLLSRKHEKLVPNSNSNEGCEMGDSDGAN